MINSEVCGAAENAVPHCAMYKYIAAGDTIIPHSSFLTFPIVGLSIILDTIIKKFDRRKPFEGTHRTVVCST